MAELEPPKIVTPPDIPYSNEVRLEIEDAFKGMTGRYKTRYRYGGPGQIQILSKEMNVLKTLQLKHYRPITTEERAAMEEERLEKLAALDTLFEQKRKKLREAMIAYKATGAIEPVLEANQEANDVELQRILVRTPIRNVKQVAIPETRDVLFDEPYEKRKLFGSTNLFKPQFDKEGKLLWEDPLLSGIFKLERRAFAPSLFYGRYEDKAVAVDERDRAVVEETGAGRVRLDNGSLARIFEEADDEHNGFLSPSYVVEFVYKETKYSSAFQAYEAERMRQHKEDRVRTALLKTRSVRTIRTLTRKVTQPVANPRALWLDIFTSLYAQHPELAEKLKATGTDLLVYADSVGGVGLAHEDKKILSPKQWPQENIVGSVLEVIRARLREKAPGEVAPAGGAKEEVISEEEQKKAKVAAIINARRRFH
jgi:predicted NAD-dependent protein-ADP-ribosyltransferase YbiA (DUF1768 family)